MFTTKKELNDFFESEEDEPVGTSLNGKIDKTGVFYHVTSHSFNDDKIYYYETAQYRQSLLFEICKRNKVILIFSVIQPTHSHDVFMCKRFEDIMKTMIELNHKVAHFIKINNERHYSVSGVKVFRNRPSYQIITTYSHLLYLAKYLYDNGEEIRKQDKRPPYCCFDEFKRGFFKNYPKDLYFKIFGLDIETITEKCIELSSEQFRKFCDSLFVDVDKKLEKKIFHV